MTTYNNCVCDGGGGGGEEASLRRKEKILMVRQSVVSAIRLSPVEGPGFWPKITEHGLTILYLHVLLRLGKLQS